MARFVLRLSLVLWIITPLSFAQDALSGVPLFSTQQGGQYDSINAANGNIKIDIPIRHKVGKIPFDLDLVGNFHAILNAIPPAPNQWSVTGWTFFPEYIGNGYYGGGNGIDVKSADYTVSLSSSKTRTDPCNGHNVDFEHTNFYFIDDTGALHPLPGIDYDDYGCIGTFPQSSMTTDGSGYYVTFNSTTSTTVWDRDGNKRTAVGASTTVTDPDGATIQQTLNGLTWTYMDTLAQSPLTWTIPLDGITNTFSYTDGNSMSQNVYETMTQYTQQTHFQCCTDADLNPYALFFPTSIQLPDGETYGIQYETILGYPNTVTTGRVTKLTLPSGGYIQYIYGSNSCTVPGMLSTLTRKVYDGTNTYTWTYTFTALAGSNTKTVITRPDNTTETYYFAGNFQTEHILGAMTQITCYNGNFSNCVQPASVPTLPLSKTDVYTSYDGVNASVLETTYDSNANPLVITRYASSQTIPPTGAPTGSNLSKETLAYGSWNGTACDNSALTSNHIIDRVCSDIMVDGSSNTLHKTYFTYTSTGHTTQTERWVTGPSYLTTNMVYASNGRLTSITEPNGALTQFNSPTCNSLLPTSIVSPLTSVGSASQTWDCGGGVQSSFTDVNGKVTHYYHNDIFWRPSSTTRADGGSTSWMYTTPNGGPWSVATNTAIDGTRTRSDTVNLDGLSRRTTTTLNDPGGAVNTKVVYDSLGRVQESDMPYRSGDPGIGIDYYTYDALGRITNLTHSNGYYISYSYTNRAVQVTDEEGKSRVYQYDLWGRLSFVCEVTTVTQANNHAPSSCGGDIAKTGFKTSYTYDSADRLTQVTQTDLVNRTFAYDGLDRLTSEVSPEGGTSTFTYDATGQEGDLATRVQPKPNQTNAGVTVTTTYTFDKMHRLIQRSYNDGTTPTATFSYDQSSVSGVNPQNPKGRPTYASVGTASTIFSYDPVGRVVDSWQCTPLNCGSSLFDLKYAYNYAGEPTSFSDYANTGSGSDHVTLTYTYNTIGQLTGLTSSWSDTTHPASLFSNVGYNAKSELLSATLGNAVGVTRTYDYRGRPLTEQDGSLYNYTLTYFGNSNVKTATDSINGSWTYAYDDFNRLQSTTGPSSYTFTYDQFGNRWHQDLTGGSGVTTDYTFDTCVNCSGHSRITGWTYDAAGNVTNDTYHSYTYDAEHRIVTVDGTAASYSYDALGNRIRATVGASTTDYIYDPMNRAVDWYNGGGVWSKSRIYVGSRHLLTYGGQHTYFQHTDWLGTMRVRSLETGAGAESCTNGPYGDNLSCLGGGLPDPTHFIGDFLDSESNLTQAQFRYLSTTAGRWTVPDPARPYSAMNPQSWNLYAYAGNNPLTFADPSGLQESCSGDCPKTLFPGGNAGGDSERSFDQGWFRGWHLPVRLDRVGATETGRNGYVDHGIDTQPELENTGFVLYTLVIQEAPAEDAIGNLIQDIYDLAFSTVKSANSVFFAGTFYPDDFGTGLIRVGRWMSTEELEKMRSTGRVVESTNEGVTSVTVPPNPSAYKNAPEGDIFVEFEVPGEAVHMIGGGWGKIYGPSSVPFGEYYGIEEMPFVTGIEVLGEIP